MKKIIGPATTACLSVSLVFCCCAPLQPTTPAIHVSDYTPTGMLQSVTMRDSSVHYDPTVLEPGSSRNRVKATFGEPNATATIPGGKNEDIYAFNPDGSKFVNPQVRPRNLALGFFTRGMSVAVRQARLNMTEKKLTLYHVVYTPEDVVESVRKEKMSAAPETGPALQ